jgi:hypothetical protein
VPFVHCLQLSHHLGVKFIQWHRIATSAHEAFTQPQDACLLFNTASCCRVAGAVPVVHCLQTHDIKKPLHSGCAG